MYIPSTFFSSQGACIVSSTNTISGSGLITSGTFASGSVLYQYYKFETADYTDPTYQSFTASLNILSGSTGQAKLLIVGAGGAGGSGGAISANFAAGGGGGGGVVYYNNFPISSGSFEIAVGGATTQINAGATGSSGRNSYIKLPNNITYTPFTSSFLTAYGGGGGGWGQIDGVMPFTCLSTNGRTGPTTGGIGIYTQQCGSRNAPDTIYTTLNGITLGPQGFKGGNITAGSGFVMAATGGGGAGTVGVSLTANDLNFGTYASNGGDGLQFNLTGTSTYFSPGGGGQAEQGDTGTTGLGGNTYGRGGQGERDGNTTQINFGFGGVVIIVWPICLADSDNCKTYTISGGATGGTMTYIPCDTQTLTTTTIDFGYTGSACLYNVAGYPTTTGTVTLTQVGTCNTFIPIAPTVTCTPPLVKTPVNIYNYSLPGQCYPTPSSCQRLFYPTQTINYVDVNAVSQSVQVGGWFTGTGQICARSQPTPRITGGTITNSGLICGYYCSGSI